ncbi:MAG: GNAT family N-acetyltransferase [Anaerolineae bacterium]|nr:GNAT family N-acetyltransferase [Anaerolineae bacterium]
MQKQYAPEPHYYLNTIAVLPEAQGKGLASQLIKPFLANADAEGVSVYTETMTPANVGLYEHYGFRVMEQYHVPQTDLSIWSFYRAG